MKCSDCPVFQPLVRESKGCSDYELHMIETYGELGTCLLFNCPKRERDVMDCDISIEESYLKLLKSKIKLAEKVIHHCKNRRKK